MGKKDAEGRKKAGKKREGAAAATASAKPAKGKATASKPARATSSKLSKGAAAKPAGAKDRGTGSTPEVALVPGGDAFPATVPVVALAMRAGELVVALPTGSLPTARLRAGDTLAGAARRALTDAGLDTRADVVPLATALSDDVLTLSFVTLRRPVDVDATAPWTPATAAPDPSGLIGAAVDRLAALLETTTLATALVPLTFTVGELREVYRAVWGVEPDGRNFHRKLTGEPGLLVATGERTARSGGRPAMLYRAGTGTRLNPALSRASAPL